MFCFFFSSGNLEEGKSQSERQASCNKQPPGSCTVTKSRSSRPTVNRLPGGDANPVCRELGGGRGTKPIRPPFVCFCISTMFRVIWLREIKHEPMCLPSHWWTLCLRLTGIVSFHSNSLADFLGREKKICVPFRSFKNLSFLKGKI